MFDAALWNNTTADSEFGDNAPPNPGTYNVTIAEAKVALTGESKDTPTVIVEYRTGDGAQWSDVKQLTSEGRVKSAKILLRDLGLDPQALPTLEAIHAGLKSLEGKFYTVSVADSNTLNAKTGTFFRNTSILGPYQPTGAPAPAGTPAPAPVPVGAGAPDPGFTGF